LERREERGVQVEKVDKLSGKVVVILGGAAVHRGLVSLGDGGLDVEVLEECLSLVGLVRVEATLAAG
jgi:hypothetical protein